MKRGFNHCEKGLKPLWKGDSTTVKRGFNHYENGIQPLWKGDSTTVKRGFNHYEKRIQPLWKGDSTTVNRGFDLTSLKGVCWLYGRNKIYQVFLRAGHKWLPHFWRMSLFACKRRFEVELSLCIKIIKKQCQISIKKKLDLIPYHVPND
jgi:hypothetical protein